MLKSRNRWWTVVRRASGFVLVFTLPGEVGAQDVRLTEPDGVAADEFSLIRGVRELPDASVLVSDYTEQRVVRVWFDGRATVRVGRVGGGPREYRLPAELLWMPGDSSLLVDYGNQRLMVLDPEERFVRTMSVHAHGEEYAMRPRAVTVDGHLVFPFPVWAGPPPPRDSVPVGRWRPGAQVQSIGDFQVRAHTVKPPGPSTGMPYIGFAKQDAWTASADGDVVVVRSDPYRVEWYDAGGGVVMSNEIAYEQLPVTMADRREHVRRFLAGSAVTGRPGSDGEGVYGQVPAEMRSEAAVNRIARNALFEDEFPPFEPGSARLDGNGRVWVRISLPAGSAAQYDVFSRNGDRTQVTLQADREVVGFGTGTVYVTVRDEFDLLRLERYRLP